jgi:DNA-binding transcriptional LysR family regulator
VAALRQAGRTCEFVYTSRSLVSLAAAVQAGFGVIAMPRGRASKKGLVVWEGPPLPKLPELYCGIYVREGGTSAEINDLADYLEDLRNEPMEPGEEQPSGIISVMRPSKVG